MTARSTEAPALLPLLGDREIDPIRKAGCEPRSISATAATLLLLPLQIVVASRTAAFTRTQHPIPHAPRVQ